jgi:hypothetical protein
VDVTRASDAERERVADRLRAATLEGRLDAEDLDERLAAAYGARTRGELSALLADLPEPPRAPLPAAGAHSAFPAPRRRPAVLVPTLTAVVVVLGVLALVLPPEAWLALAITTVVLTFLVVALLAGLAPFLAAGGAAWWIVRRMSRDAGGPSRAPEAPGWADPERPGPGRG